MTEFRPHKLTDEQSAASRPGDNVWLSASAGTGKTSVLAARVKRLLIEGARPDSILCLTFTRAGAAEMSHRVHRDLARWAMMSAPDLHKELFALDQDYGPDKVDFARTLFARVLEARGGGLRVMTIHAFCQTLLGTFPLEAGLAPGFRAIEGREQAALAARVLADLAETAERERDARLTAALGALSLRLGEGAAESFLLRAARHVEKLEALPEGIDASVRRALDIPADFDADYIPTLCCDDMIDRQGLLSLSAMQVGWNTATGLKNAERVSEWLLGTPAERAADLATLRLAWATKGGTLQKNGPKDAGYADLAARLDAWCGALCDLAARAALADDIGHALVAARRYARAYAEAKRAGGLVDFDDLIARAVALLTTPGMGDWIAYKLDQATDHILVDESQDTNEDQWAIVKALAGEFWAGEGAKGKARRTIFSVGDYKQAIFGFQGTHPRHYAKARDDFAATIGASGRRLIDLGLQHSFRSSPPVLAVVDSLLDELGEDGFGENAADRHVSASDGPGSVTLLPPVRVPDRDDSDDEEGWVAHVTRELAARIARQVRDWLDEGLWLGTKGRPVAPGDIMILVRKRSDLAALLVARLQKEKVPVAGVDRLRLAAPLAVKDCMAAVRFAVQPDDDLTLASLLVSPICGWTQDDLYAAAHGERQGALWRNLRGGDFDIDVPRRLLAMADFATPYRFLEAMLSGDIGARAKLLRRLGNAAADPIDELLNAALQFEREGVATLQGFVDWFDRGEGEIVRDAGTGGDAVRVMTVHAAKGLESPLVVIADATTDPADAPNRDFQWVIDATLVPLFRPRATERRLHATLERFAELQAEDDRREHWRLLYVAMTRAAEQLWIAGSLTARKRAVPEDSWHSAIDRAMARMGAVEVDYGAWGAVRRHAVEVGGRRAPALMRDAPDPVARPPWLDRPAPPEARPPRPLAPSSLGVDTVADPPPGAAMRAAAERGRLIHALFERLPKIATDRRRIAALDWLERSAGVDDAAIRSDVANAVLGVIDDPAFAHLFGPDGLSEIPVAGVVDGLVVSGTVDRLIVGDAAVDVIDFKTTRRVPSGVAAVPDLYKRQMAAYVAVLRGVFPDKAVRASLLYTAGAKLIALTDADLDAHKPRYADAEQDLSVTG